MVAKNDTVTAARLIEEALEAFPRSNATTKAHVFETEWGQLRALVGSDVFKGMPLAERQDVVWKHLRERVPAECLENLYGVHPMDLDEYDARTGIAGNGGGA